MTQQDCGPLGTVTSLSVPTTTNSSSDTTTIKHEHNQHIQQHHHSHPQQQQPHLVASSTQHHKQQQQQTTNLMTSSYRHAVTNGSSCVQALDGQRSNNSFTRETRVSRTPSGGRITGGDSLTVHRKEPKKERLPSSYPEPSVMEPRITRSSAIGRSVDSGSSGNEDEASGARYHRSGMIISRGDNMISVRDKLPLTVNGKTMMNGSISKLECARDHCLTQQNLSCRKANLESSNFRVKPTCTLRDSTLILPRNRTSLNLRIRPYNISHRGSSVNKS